MRRSISWLPGKGGWLPDGDGVFVRSGGSKGQLDACARRALKCELLHQATDALGTSVCKHIVERIQPLSFF